MNWANKKQNNFNIYNVALLKKKIKKNTYRYHYQNLDDMIYISWDIEHNILKLVVLGHFLLFHHLKYSKNQNFGKWKNLLEISSFCTCVTKITIMRFIVPEIRSETDWIFVILGHFLSFYLSNNAEKKKKKSLEI